MRRLTSALIGLVLVAGPASAQTRTVTADRLALDATNLDVTLSRAASNTLAIAATAGVRVGSAYQDNISIASGGGDSRIGSNFYYSSGWKRVFGSYAWALGTVDGTTTFYDAAWGAADDAITWTARTAFPYGGGVNPGANWNYDIGTNALRWKTLYAAELAVWRLVAKDVIASIGGEIWTSETTTLSAALGDGAGDTTLTVVHNFLEDGDFVILKDLTNIEVLEVDSAAGGSAGAYTYTVVRDKDGSGRNAWATGVAVVSTGKAAGEGFISQYASTTEADGLLSTPVTLVGPALLGVTRTGTSWNSLAPRWLIGNLNGACGYSANTYGLVAGDCAETWIAADATNGFRVMHGATELLTASAAGVLTAIGGTFKSASGTGARVELTSAGIKGYNASNALLYTADGTGLALTVPADYDNTLAYKWDDSGASIKPGLYYRYASGISSRVLRLSMPDPGGGQYRLSLSVGASEIVMDTGQLTPISGTIDLGTSGDAWGAAYVTSLYINGLASSAFTPSAFAGETCDWGKFVSAVSATDGVVSGITCTTPSPLAELASLRALVFDLQARLAALEAERRVR